MRDELKLGKRIQDQREPKLHYKTPEVDINIWYELTS